MTSNHYYAQRKTIKDGTAQPVINKFGTNVDMEYQYHLFCASATKNEADNDFERVEWGTIEHGVIECKTFNRNNADPRPVVEPEPEES